MNEIVLNLVDQVKVTYGKNPKLLRKNYYLSHNGCILGEYLSAVLTQYIPLGKNYLFSDGDFAPSHPCAEMTDHRLITTGDIGSMPRNTCAVFTINCMDPRYESEEEQTLLEERLTQCCRRFSQKGLVVVAMVVPEPENCPEGVNALAEREYDYYLYQKQEHTWQESFYLRLEEAMRRCCNVKHPRIIGLRFTNILGPDCSELVQAFDMNELLRQAVEDKNIIVNEDDAVVSFSYTAVEHALYATLLVIANPRRELGRVLNVATDKTTALDLKWAMYKAFPEEITLDGLKVTQPTSVYRRLNTTYFKALFPKLQKRKRTLGEQMYRIACCYSEQPYDIRRKLGIYEGRLAMICDAEKRMLKVIDQICRENDIQYFLAGGTALGAVRHQDVIPWDDDIDIGMLREDYEKFRKVAPGLLPPELSYEAAGGKSKSHYHFDKIRLKQTYFSTKYSNYFRIPDGVFIDILVYDKTSNVRFWQKVHIRLTAMWTRVINIKWVNKPRKNIHYKASKIALPIMRLISWKWFHWVFERIIRHYEKRENSKYAIDSVGLNIKKGALRLEWMQEVEYMPFGDMMAPVPKQYDSYLKHFYGPNYMNMLPVDRRVSGHHIARLDLGPVLYGMPELEMVQPVEEQPDEGLVAEQLPGNEQPSVAEQLPENELPSVAEQLPENAVPERVEFRNLSLRGSLFERYKRIAAVEAEVGLQDEGGLFESIAEASETLLERNEAVFRGDAADETDEVFRGDAADETDEAYALDEMFENGEAEMSASSSEITEEEEEE